MFKRETQLLINKHVHKYRCMYMYILYRFVVMVKSRAISINKVTYMYNISPQELFLNNQTSKPDYTLLTSVFLF